MRVRGMTCELAALLLCLGSLGPSEGENERGAQQALVGHRRPPAHRVQREVAAPSEGAHGRPRGQGETCASPVNVTFKLQEQNNQLFALTQPLSALLVQNSLIQDLENCQKQLEEFHHTRVSLAEMTH